MIKKLQEFLKEVYQEFRNVSWPNKDEIIGLTVAIIITTLLFGIYVGLVDRLLGVLVKLILS